MTLSQARTYLAPYIENGRCSDATVVRTIINEAQRRLHATSNYLGTIKRWGVTVDENGEFSIPTGAESVIRISVLPTGLTHSTNGTVVATGPYAFVFDSPSLLRFTMIRPNRFKILGPYPTAVDVMGKVAYVDAVNSTDVLIIDDKDALKLMVLGLWRENNNAPELANDLIGKAQAHLDTKTNVAVESAKTALFQNMLASCQPGTRGYARAKLSLASTGGDRTTDAQMAEILDDAEKRIMSRTQFWHSYLCKAVGGYFAVPHEIESILRVDVNNCPTHLYGPTAEYIETGVGYREATYGPNKGVSVIYRGDFALQADMPYASQITIRSGGSSRGIKINIEGYGENGDRLYETVTINGSDLAISANTYADITSITADPRDGELSFIVGTTEIAYMQAYETNSTRARYAIPSPSEGCEEQILRILGRARWIPKIRDEQRMQVDNVQALVLMSAAIQLERAGKIQESEVFEAKAIRLVEEEMRNKMVGNSVRIDRHPTGATLKGVRGGR
jgi:hypothetical protein